jgi:glutaredoxin-related protein
VKHFIQLFYSDHCPGCAEARDVVRRLASSRPDVAVVEFDVAVHLASTRRCGVIATPAVVVDDGPALYGVPSPAAIEARIRRE